MIATAARPSAGQRQTVLLTVAATSPLARSLEHRPTGHLRAVAHWEAAPWKAAMTGQQVSKVKLSTQPFGDGPTMTKRSSTPADAVLVASDMSKHRQEVLIERLEGGRRRRMTIMATKADYDRLADELSSIGRSRRSRRVPTRTARPIRPECLTALPRSLHPPAWPARMHRRAQRTKRRRTEPATQTGRDAISRPVFHERHATHENPEGIP